MELEYKMKEELKEVVLALSGGGARGAYHLGVLQYLDEKNIKIKAICSTSIGSLIAISYASGVSPKEQLEIFKSDETKKMFKFNWFRGSIFSIDMDSLSIEKLFKKKMVEELNIPVYITAVDFKNGNEVTYDNGDIKKICQASTALIPAFKPVEYDGKLLIDGGVVNHMPYEPLIKYKLPIVGVNLKPLIKENPKPTIISYIKKALQILMYKTADSQKDQYDIYIKSNEINQYSILSLKNFDALYELGYAETKKVFENYE